MILYDYDQLVQFAKYKLINYTIPELTSIKYFEDDCSTGSESKRKFNKCRVTILHTLWQLCVYIFKLLNHQNKM